MSGTPCVAITTSNRAATSSGSVASHAKVTPAVSSASFCSLSGLREASATCKPFLANSRASEALRPGPTPTINAVFIFISASSGDGYYDARNIGRFGGKQPEDGGGDFVGAANAAHGHAADQTCQPIRQSCTGVQIGLNEAGADRVHTDPPRGQFFRGADCQTVQCPLRRGVMDPLARPTEFGGARRNI